VDLKYVAAVVVFASEVSASACPLALQPAVTSKIAVFNAEQFLNAFAPILFTPLEIVTLARLEQPTNV
jgi:hypothetical protein